MQLQGVQQIFPELLGVRIIYFIKLCSLVFKQNSLGKSFFSLFEKKWYKYGEYTITKFIYSFEW